MAQLKYTTHIVRKIVMMMSSKFARVIELRGIKPGSKIYVNEYSYDCVTKNVYEAPYNAPFIDGESCRLRVALQPDTVGVQAIVSKKGYNDYNIDFDTSQSSPTEEPLVAIVNQEVDLTPYLYNRVPLRLRYSDSTADNTSTASTSGGPPNPYTYIDVANSESVLTFDPEAPTPEENAEQAEAELRQLLLDEKLRQTIMKATKKLLGESQKDLIGEEEKEEKPENKKTKRPKRGIVL